MCIHQMISEGVFGKIVGFTESGSSSGVFSETSQILAEEDPTPLLLDAISSGESSCLFSSVDSVCKTLGRGSPSKLIKLKPIKIGKE